MNHIEYKDKTTKYMQITNNNMDTYNKFSTNRDANAKHVKHFAEHKFRTNSIYNRAHARPN